MGILKHNPPHQRVLNSDAAACATALSSSTVLPETPMPPACFPSLVMRGTPPGNVINPWLECSMLNRLPPGWDREPIMSVSIWSTRDTRDRDCGLGRKG